MEFHARAQFEFPGGGIDERPGQRERGDLCEIGAALDQRFHHLAIDGVRLAFILGMGIEGEAVALAGPTQRVLSKGGTGEKHHGRRDAKELPHLRTQSSIVVSKACITGAKARSIPLSRLQYPLYNRGRAHRRASRTCVGIGRLALVIVSCGVFAENRFSLFRTPLEDFST